MTVVLSAVDRDAMDMLTRRGVPVERIVRVEPDSVLYIGSGGRPMTAWMHVHRGRLRLAFQAGFVAEPSADALRQLDPAPPLGRSEAREDLQGDEP